VNTITAARRRRFSTAILAWYKENRRALPWRKTRDPYKILVSEIMLQQTQVSRVIPIYEAFLAQFPTLEALGDAPLSSVIRAWKGLGYNRRAKLLWELARHEKRYLLYGKEAKVSPALLTQLPGIGHYTANAVAAFAWNADAAPVDTNIRRVHTRYFGADAYSDELPARTLPVGNARAWNNALMDFGSAVCTKQPVCERCPLRRSCVAYKTNSFTVAVPKQSTFKGSNRYYRGQILDALRMQPFTAAELDRTIATSAQEREKTRGALAQLIREGFVTTRADKRYALAEHSKQTSESKA
jgi:A/G-specific adenine glycosylase